MYSVISHNLRKNTNLGLVTLIHRSSDSLPEHPEIRPNILLGYVDSDWAGCPDSDSIWSTSVSFFMLNFAAILWCSKRQPTVALS
jgi:hypothetical protein